MTLRSIQKTRERRRPALRVVLLYAHKDKKLVNELRKHLRLLEIQGLIDLWYDVEIVPGRDWDMTIREKIAGADVVCPCISSDFFNSDYIAKVELPKILELEKSGRVVICPIVIRAYLWRDICDLGRFHALPSGAKPVKTWRDRDEAGVSVAEGLCRLVRDILAKRMRTGGQKAA